MVGRVSTLRGCVGAGSRSLGSGWISLSVPYALLCPRDEGPGRMRVGTKAREAGGGGVLSSVF